MKYGPLLAIILGLALGAAFAQNAPAPAPNQPNGPAGPGLSGAGHGRWSGGAGRAGINGTVTAVAGDHYTIKSDAGEVYTIHYSVNTRILKQSVQRGGEGGGGNSPQTLKATDIKVGDALAAIGEVDEVDKSVGAVLIMQIDPERAKQLREMQANFGKTWVMGKVTAINETTVTLFSTIDNASHSFVADENTTFRKRREPITLADIAVGDGLRAEGAVKGNRFVATSVAVIGMPQGGPPTLPRDGAAPQQSGK